MSVMKQISNIAFIAAAAIVAFTLALIFYSILRTQNVPTAFFWTGVTSLIVALIFYFAHAVTSRGEVLAVSGGFCVIGFISFYASIGYSSVEFEGKVLPFIILSIFVIIILLMIGLMTKGSAKDKAREARRKKY